MKLNVGIVGYGNLGKSLEQEIRKNDKMALRAIYSRRSLDHSLFRPFDAIENCADIDVALVALGSYGDLLENAQKLAAVDTVDSYDVHARIGEYKATLNKVKPNKLSIISAGWDPGLLSMARGVFGVGATRSVTVWGRGISQGHSNALRSIAGVIDAVQFTAPVECFDELIEQGENDAKKLLVRQCFVACVASDKDDVEKKIRAMPHYFDGYKTEVTFCSPQEVRELKKATQHKGVVRCFGEGFDARAEVSMQSNADYTAQIMIAYALALPQLKRDGYKGALDVFDIPLRYVADTELI